MDFITAIAVLVFVVIMLLLIVRAKKPAVLEAGPWPFYAKRPLSDPELILYRRLAMALPGHIVLAQVSLGRLLGVKKGHNFSQWYNRINRMSADFVLCGKDGKVVAVMELDDSTHEKPDRKAADAKKDRALGDAGIRIIRWQARTLPDETTIRSTFADAQQAVQRNDPASGGTAR